VVYYVLLKITLPVVWFVTAISNGLLRLFGVRGDQTTQHNLTLDELRTIVTDAGALLPRRRQRMLMSILELEDMIVDEMMIPTTNSWASISMMTGRPSSTRSPGRLTAVFRSIAATSRTWRDSSTSARWLESWRAPSISSH